MLGLAVVAHASIVSVALPGGTRFSVERTKRLDRLAISGRRGDVRASALLTLTDRTSSEEADSAARPLAIFGRGPTSGTARLYLCYPEESGVYGYRRVKILDLALRGHRLVFARRCEFDFSDYGSWCIRSPNRVEYWDYDDSEAPHRGPHHYLLWQIRLGAHPIKRLVGRTRRKYDWDDEDGSQPPRRPPWRNDPLREFGRVWRWWGDSSRKGSQVPFSFDFQVRSASFGHPRRMEPCFHGGAFWDAVPLDRLEKRRNVVNADVLDAWFPPAPSVVAALSDEWLLRTSPPTHAEPMERAIGEAFGVPSETVLAGPGSSALAFLAFCRWLSPASRVLLVEPTYGEYAHLCEQVVGCRVDRFVTGWNEPLDLGRWADAASGYDLAVLVNPNNPTGTTIPTADLIAALPTGPRLWVDEAYLAYTDKPSLAPYSLDRPSLFVVRSLSKSHALSGLRAAALFGSPSSLAPLRPHCPPWWVSLPAQVATVAALRETAYYRERYAQTHTLRRALAAALGGESAGDAANWLLTRLPDDGPTAKTVVVRCAEQGVFLRDAGRTAASLGDRTLRIASKPEWERIVRAIRHATQP